MKHSFPSLGVPFSLFYPNFYHRRWSTLLHVQVTSCETFKFHSHPKKEKKDGWNMIYVQNTHLDTSFSLGKIRLIDGARLPFSHAVPHYGEYFSYFFLSLIKILTHLCTLPPALFATLALQPKWRCLTLTIFTFTFKIFLVNCF